MIELEKTYLAKYLPANIQEYKSIQIVDLYLFSHIKNSKFRIRQYFCLIDVTNESFVAGGNLAGKNYSDISKYLHKFSYKNITYN